MNSLFSQSLNVINEGLASFADNIRQAGGEVTPLNWQPPAEGDRFTGLSSRGLLTIPSWSAPIRWQWGAILTLSRY
jgi:hypothetical protein